MKREIWSLACNLVAAQHNLAGYEASELSIRIKQAMVKREESKTQRVIDEILARNDSEEILAAVPLAQKYMNEVDARMQLVSETTVIGPFRQALIKLIAARDLESHTLLDMDFVGLGFTDSETKTWKQFESAVRSGDKLRIVQEVTKLLSTVRVDLALQESLPPPPSLPEFDEE